MKIVHGKLKDEYLAPIWFMGVMHDIDMSGSYQTILVFGSWYVGVAFKTRS